MVMTALVAGLVVSGCASKNVFGVNEEGDPQSPDQILQTRYIPNECGAHISNEDLEGYYCRFLGARNAYHLAGSRYQHAVEAQNILTFGAAVYAGSTLALNSGGLRESQTDDLTETALGLGVIQAAASLLGVQRRNTLYRHASDASYCYASHIRMLIVRERALEQLVSDPTDINSQFDILGAINSVEGGLSYIQGANPRLLSDEERDDAATLIEAARALQTQLRAQRRLLLIAQSQMPDTAYRFVRSVEEAARNKPIDYASLITTIREAAAAGLPSMEQDFENKRESFDDQSEFNERQDEELRQAFDAAIENLHGEMRRAETLMPNINPIRVSLQSCQTVLENGDPVRFNPTDTPAVVFSLSGSQNSAQ
jgi:hypothetical protein